MSIPAAPDPHERMRKVTDKLSPQTFTPGSTPSTPLDRSDAQSLQRRAVIHRHSQAELPASGEMFVYHLVKLDVDEYFLRVIEKKRRVVTEVFGFDIFGD